MTDFSLNSQNWPMTAYNSHGSEHDFRPGFWNISHSVNNNGFFLEPQRRPITQTEGKKNQKLFFEEEQQIAFLRQLLKQFKQIIYSLVGIFLLGCSI